MITKLLLILALLVCVTILPSNAAKTKGKFLVVLSSDHTLALKDGKKHETGYFLNEMAVPVKALVDAGYEPVFADPEGNPPVMDPISDKEKFFEDNHAAYESIKSFVAGLHGLKKPIRLHDALKGVDGYAGIFVPGGHAPMINLWHDRDLGEILRYFHEHHKPTAMICHGPIALLSSLADPKAIPEAMKKGTSEHKPKWQYAGYHVTVFSDSEEKPNEPGMLGGFMQFYPEDALRAAGADVSVGPPGKSHVVQDKELVTGQNPFSDNELASAFIKMLEKKP